MFSTILSTSNSPPRKSPAEGELYKTLYIKGIKFDLFYGYYEDSDRHFSEPYVLYPNFLESPVYTEDGFPFATMMQEACSDFESTKNTDRDCSQCKHFIKCDELLGVCMNPSKQSVNQYSQKE
ncbi:MAG: hypothetical protein J6S71_10535 [Clostridia bacterium]|nr:hypothetical protein [Clostridia bacterium]